jgi:hypothetical protein
VRLACSSLPTSISPRTDVGPCKSLQFGIVSLTDYASTHGGTLVPVVIQLSIAEIEARGLDHEGIYVRVACATSSGF